VPAGGVEAYHFVASEPPACRARLRDLRRPLASDKRAASRRPTWCRHLRLLHVGLGRTSWTTNQDLLLHSRSVIRLGERGAGGRSFSPSLARAHHHIGAGSALQLRVDHGLATAVPKRRYSAACTIFTTSLAGVTASQPTSTPELRGGRPWSLNSRTTSSATNASALSGDLAQRAQHPLPPLAHQRLARVW